MRKRFTFLALSAFIASTSSSVAQNKALDLKNGSYVNTSSTDVIPSDIDFSIEFWVYVNHTDVDNQRHQFVSQGTTDGSAFYVGYDGSDQTILVSDFWGGTGISSTGVKMPFDQWTHLAVTFNSSSFSGTLYVNGVAKASKTLFFNADQPFRIGVQTDLSQVATAKIDELKTWNIERSAFDVKKDMFGDPDPTDPTLQSWYKMNEGSGTNVFNSSTLRGSNQDGEILNDPGGSNSWTNSPIQTSTNGLTFLGSENDQVVIPTTPGYDAIGNGPGGTVEFWVNPSSLSGSFSTILGKYNHYSFLLSTTQIGIDNGTAINTYTLDAGDFPLGFPTNTWSHLAFVYNGTDHTDVYFNGLILGQIPGIFGTPTGTEPITLGVSRDNGGTATRQFTGGIDEVRLWSSKQSDIDIFNNTNNSLTGTEANLLSQFTFDAGVPDGDNTGMKVAFDNAAGNHGELNNFQLSGTTSNINFHLLNIVPLPISLTKFTARKNGNEALLQWQTASEQNSKDFTIERSSDGKSFTTIGVVAAAGNSTNAVDYTFADRTPINGSNYYRLKQSDLDTKFTYSPLRLVNFGATGKLLWQNTGKHSAEVYLQQGNNENYSVSDISGHVLRQGQLSSGRTDISNLPSGIYFVKVITGTGGIAVTKIVLY